MRKKRKDKIRQNASVKARERTSLTKNHLSKNYLLPSISLFLAIIILISLWLLSPFYKSRHEVKSGLTVLPVTNIPGKHVIIHLNTMTLELRSGDIVLATLPLISQGKPGSYYETIGGSYINDYKVPLHFSSIGHVYMPYSVHLFGNYFIHGIPYYPNGQKVSSAYSGGCIRLSNADARTVYDFIQKGTPIIITRDSEMSFNATEEQGMSLTSSDMTNMMVATISLEALTQDNQILDIDGMNYTTRKALLPRLILNGDTRVSRLYARSIGEPAFVSLMNQKAQSLGLSSTHFTDSTSAASTTDEDYDRFMTYISTYKSYIRTLQSKDLSGPPLRDPTSKSL